MSLLKKYLRSLYFSENEENNENNEQLLEVLRKEKFQPQALNISILAFFHQATGITVVITLMAMIL